MSNSHWTAAQAASILGIDVSQATLDCFRLSDQRHWQVPNTPQGWQTLVTTLTHEPPALVVLEATGKLEAGVVVALDAGGFTPAVENPLHVKHFRRSLGRRAKTDRSDAEVLALYGERVQPVPRAVAPEIERELRALLARREQLTKQRTQEKNRATRTDGAAGASVARMLVVLTAERKTIDALLAGLVATEPRIQSRVTRLQSVPGIGVYLATVLAVELRELGQLPKRALAALVGVAPYNQESGTHVGARSIGGGRPRVRRGLFQAVQTTVRLDPALQAHYQQLRARGKCHKQAIVASINRLLGILNVMERDDLVWAQTKVGQGVFLPSAA
jgi:transposase